MRRIATALAFIGVLGIGATTASLAAKPVTKTTPRKAAASATTPGATASVTTRALTTSTNATTPRTVVIHNDGAWFALLLPALVWPAVFLVILLPLATHRGRALVRQLGVRVDSFDIFGVVGLKLSDETSGRIKRAIQGLIDDYRTEADRSLARLSSSAELEAKVRDLADNHIKTYMRGDFRCAVYVQDMLFEEGIAQVTNYYPEFTVGAGRVVGRWFGHVGRAFRAGESMTNGNVTANPKRLVNEYGMTPAEAAPRLHGKPRRSFSCVMLPLGALKSQAAIYIDAVDHHAFLLPPAQFEAAVKDSAHRVGITEALVGVVAEIQAIGLDVDVKLTRSR